MENLRVVVFLVTMVGLPSVALADQQAIGDELIQPGIAIHFAGVKKGEVTPAEQHLTMEKTDLHLVAKANWAKDPKTLVPGNAPRGGFVPFLKINVEITNESTGKALFASLIPHVNLGDNLHYARNIALPGELSERYEITFFVNPPTEFEVSFHKDWRGAHGAKFFGPKKYTYSNVSFSILADE